MALLITCYDHVINLSESGGEMMRKKLSLLLVLLLIMAAFAGCGGGGGGGGNEAVDTDEETGFTSDEIFKVGAIYPLSGGNAAQGNQCLDAVQIAIDFVNAEGGVQGMEVELFTADAPDPTAATTEAGRLVDREGVSVVFGSLASGNALAIAGVTDKSGVTLVESGGILDALTDSGYKNVFRILDKGGLRASVGIEYIGNVLTDILGIPKEDLKIAIVHEESGYGTSVADGAEAKAKEMGMQVVLRENYNTSITDMSSMVLKVKNAQPDVLISVCYVDDAVLLCDTLKQQQAMPKVFMGCGAGTTSPLFANEIGDYSDGMFCTDMPTNLPIDVYNSDPALKATIEAFRTAFLAKNTDIGDFPPIAAEAAFTGAYTFLHNILPNAATLDADGIRAAALTTKLDMTGLGFGWDIGEDGQNYAASANINQWQGGKVVTISPDKFKNGDVINVPLPQADI